MMIRPSSSTRRAFSTWVVAVEELIWLLSSYRRRLLLHIHHRSPLTVGRRRVGAVHLPGGGGLVNLAAVAVGILRSKSLQVGQIVTASPLAGSRSVATRTGSEAPRGRSSSRPKPFWAASRRSTPLAPRPEPSREQMTC